MILTIAHQNISIGHDGNTFQTLEFGVAATPWAEGTQETAIWMKYLYAIVAWIGDNDESLVINGNTSAMVPKDESRGSH